MDTRPLRNWLNEHWRSVMLALTTYFFLAAMLRAGESPASANMIEAAMTLLVFVLLLITVTRNWWPALLIVLITFITEAVGVLGYLPFGPYDYGGAHTAIGLLGVPLFIPIAWAVIVISIARITKRWWLTGLAAVALDILFEPVAAAWSLWVWSDYTNNSLFVAPLLNYIGWFIVAAIMHPFAVKAASSRMHAYGVLFLIIFHYTANAVALGLSIAIYGLFLMGGIGVLVTRERKRNK